MKSFEIYEDLLKEIGAVSKSDFTYAKNQLASFLEDIGSDEEEPYFSFDLEFNGITYIIGVTHIEKEEDSYEYTYWLVDIKNLSGRKWKDVEYVLENHILIDDSNFDSKEGIVDFKGIYSNFSVGAKFKKVGEETTVIIDSEETIYVNN